MSKCIAYVDGASRGNPGEASVGVSLLQNDIEIDTVSKCIGIQTCLLYTSDAADE